MYDLSLHCDEDQKEVRMSEHYVKDFEINGNKFEGKQEDENSVSWTTGSLGLVVQLSFDKKNRRWHACVLNTEMPFLKAVSYPFTKEEALRSLRNQMTFYANMLMLNRDHLAGII